MNVEMETVDCPLCKNNIHQIVLENVQGKGTNLVECVGCGFRYFTPRQTWNSIKNTIFSSSNSVSQKAEAECLYEKALFFGDTADPAGHIKFVEDYYDVTFNNILAVAGYKPVKFFEVGCAIGRFLHVLNERHGYDVDQLHGTDINPYSVKIANEKYGLKRVFHSDFHEFQPKYPEQFDMIIALDYIEHTYFPKEDLLKLSSMLKSGGTLVMKTFLEDLDTEHTMLMPPCHAGHFFGDVLYSLIRRTGFKIVKWDVEVKWSQVLIVARKV